MKITPVAGKTFADIMKGVNGAKIPEDGPKIDRFLKTRKEICSLNSRAKPAAAPSRRRP